MFKDQEQKYIDLLNSEPNQFILSIQGLIEVVVQKFVKTGRIRLEEKNDLKQQVNEYLLKKMPRIQNQYQRRSSLKTYLSVIITNICNDIIKHENKITIVSLEDSMIQGYDNQALENLIFKEEIKKLKNTINLHPKNKPRLLLLLKIKFRMPVGVYDFKAVYPHITVFDFKQFMVRIGPYVENTDVKIFSALTEMTAKHENKKNTPDAIRKWIKLKINELIDLMNGDPPVSKYNEETIQILFEKCYYKETQTNSLQKNELCSSGLSVRKLANVKPWS
ncbi:MAG TPA: hypothetical protein VHO50_14185 [Bacteroidales bacterium]|nr:hypothetical protein [Bacteroidales bacterium]